MAQRALDKVPAECFVAFFSYLDFKALVAVTGTSHTWRGLALKSQHLLWPRLLAQTFSPWAYPLCADSSTFAARRSERCARLKEEALAWSHERHREKVLVKRTAAAWALDLLHIRFLAPAIGFAVLLLVAFVALKMDNQVDDWSTSAVLSPAWAVLCFLALALITGRCAWKHHMLYNEGGDLVFLFHCQEALARFPLVRVVVATLFLSFAAFFALVAVNFDQPPTGRLPWPVVFAPLWLALGVLFCAPCVHCAMRRRCQSTPLIVALVICVLVPFTIVSILAALASEKNFSIWVVMTPLWIIGGCLLCWPAMAAVHTAVKVAREEFSSRGSLVSQDNSTREVSMMICVVCSLVLPFVVTEVLLAVHLGHPGWVTGRSAMAPLMFILVVFELVLLLCACNRAPLRPRGLDDLDL